MRKILSCALLGALLLPIAAVTGCKKASNERSKYEMQLEYFPEERRLAANMRVTVPNVTGNAFEELKFQLWANAYREGAKYAPVSELYSPAAYYDGKSYGGITVTSVEGCEKFTVCGEDDNILSVSLASPLYPDESVTLDMSFEVTLAKINHRLGAGENAVNLAHYYPVLCYCPDGSFREYVYAASGDPFVNECADYDVTLTVPEDYTAISAGKPECVAQNGKKAYHVITENVRDSAFVLGKNFQSTKTKAGGVEVEYYYISDAKPELALGVAADSIAYFDKSFGDYPLTSYTVVQTDFPYGGMEFAGLSMIALDLREAEIPTVVAHETAHQWWYALVGSNQFESSWQDEGLAEFSTALFFGAHEKYGGTYSQFIEASERSYRAFFSVYSQIGGSENTAMNKPLTSFTGDYEYRNIAYDKGVILFSRLKSVVGDGKFFEGLKRYVSRYGGKIATTDDLISCFSSANAEGVIKSFTEGLCVI